MVILARESRGYSQAELAEKTGISKQQMNKYEGGVKVIPESVLKKIAAVTVYPMSFFEEHYEAYPEHLTYRKRSRTIQPQLIKMISARSNIIRFHTEKLMEALDIVPPVLPHFDVDEKNTPKVIAQKMRKLWGIDTPVPPDMVRLLESKSIPIMHTMFFTERVECRIILTRSKQPLIVYNTMILADRLRFCLAYHLGNIVMHMAKEVDYGRDIDREATEFAAEFLMPEKEIRKDLKEPITIMRLAELKKKWKMPMISILHRAHDLGFVSDMQKKYLIEMFRQHKIRKREPLDLDVEFLKPQLIRKWIAEVKEKKNWQDIQMAAFLNMRMNEYHYYYVE
jgi:Zn-dependent peptidase ImmA (M78 family)/transcriptional regulator with XRE-family HTH domain